MPRAHFLYSGIRVGNLRRSIAFYRKLGFKILHRGTMKHGGQWVQLQFPGARHRLELNYYPPKNLYYERWGHGSEFDHFGFYSADLPTWEATLQRAGARKMLDFVEGKTRIVYYRDPDGIWLEAYGPARPPRPRSRKVRP